MQVRNVGDRTLSALNDLGFYRIMGEKVYEVRAGHDGLRRRRDIEAQLQAAVR